MNDRFIEEVKSRVDLVEMVRKYADVKKSGKNFMCRSPFRNERTPSFSISSEKQMWFDFGASEGGDTVTFIQKIENCTFLEAIEIMADMAGVEIPKDFNVESKVTLEEKKDIYALHKKACDYFEAQLKASKKAQKYIDSRGLSKEITRTWNLGYGGDVQDGLSKYLLKSGFSEEQITQSGVAFQRTFGDKKMMDRFWGRIMVPIREARNSEIIAFSGRDILEREKVGKYINSPENSVYHKSSTLFGLDKARKIIKDSDQVMLVEGNFDVILAHQRGFNQTLATCGTAFTEDHVRMLKRLTDNFYLAFDNDLAGKKATLKSLEMGLKNDLNIYIVPFDAKDFGELLEDNSKVSSLQETIKNCPKALNYLLDRFEKVHLNGSLDGEKKFLKAFFYFLNLVKSPLEVDDFLNILAERTKRQKAIIEAEFEKFKKQVHKYNKPKFQEETVIKFTREENFLGFLSAFWQYFGEKIEPRKEDFFKLFTQENLKNILEKKFSGENLNKTEQQDLLSWELWQENSFEEPLDFEALKPSFDRFVKILKEENTKKQRLAQAAEIRKNLGK